MTGDTVADFLHAMEAAGVKPIEPIAQRLSGGTLVRFRADGDKPGRQNGWAILYLDGTPAGAFGSYRLGITERWRANKTEVLTADQRRQRAAEWRAAAAAREAAQKGAWAAAAVEAERLLSLGAEPAPDHPYLVKKNISGEGMRQHDGALIVPMSDAAGRVWNVQRIYGNGRKLFLKGGRTDGLMWRCGVPDAAICIGEGVGTMAAVRRATGFAVVAAFSEKNLGPVTVAVAAAHPDEDLVICADDDAHLVDHPTIKRNLGLDAARAAAAAVGARVAVPPRSNDHGC